MALAKVGRLIRDLKGVKVGRPIWDLRAVRELARKAHHPWGGRWAERQAPRDFHRNSREEGFRGLVGFAGSQATGRPNAL